MIDNSVAVFYDGDGRIRTVATIKDTSLPVNQNTYAQ